MVGTSSSSLSTTTPPGRRTRKRPPRLLSVELPTGGDDHHPPQVVRDGAYELEDPSDLLGVTTGGSAVRRRIRPRPLQSMAALAVLQSSARRQEGEGGEEGEVVSPLLRTFLDSTFGAKKDATTAAVSADTAGAGAGTVAVGTDAASAGFGGLPRAAAAVGMDDSDDGSGRQKKNGRVGEETGTGAAVGVGVAPTTTGALGEMAAIPTAPELRNAPPTPTPTPTPASLPTQTIERIDDPKSSTLTLGKHIRYRTLLSELNRMGRQRTQFVPGTSKAKEFRALRDAVREERDAYRLAMEEFRERNVERFLIGFTVPGPASKFVDAGSNAVVQYRERWTSSASAATDTAAATGGSNDLLLPPLPARYGKCVQAISLPRSVVSTMQESDFVPPDETSSAAGTSSSRRENVVATFDVDEYAARIVHSTPVPPRLYRVGVGWTEVMCDPKKGRDALLRPVSPRGGGGGGGGCPATRTLLCNDTKARDLAAKHDVHVLMTSDSWEALLRRPGHESTRWAIPLSCTKRGGADHPPSRAIVIMEDPIPRPSTTREWLTRGFGESLFEAAVRTSSSTSSSPVATAPSEGDDDEGERIQHVYTLLTIPPGPTQHGTCRVLVRSTNALLEDGETGCPVNLRTNLEYFPERGSEEYTHHERAAWILHKMLQPTSRVVVGRIDPNAADVISMEEKSVADALVAGGGGSSVCGTATAHTFAFDASAHFTAAATVVRGATKLGRGRHLLCLPGRGLAQSSQSPLTSVSVHRECSAVEAAEGGECIDVQSEIDAANSAFTSKSALLACFRAWDWKEDGTKRLPFTFPLSEDSTSS